MTTNSICHFHISVNNLLSYSVRFIEGEYMGIKEVKDLHSPKDYVIKNIGTIQICSVCRDDKGNVFVAYPCETARLLHP